MWNKCHSTNTLFLQVKHHHTYMGYQIILQDKRAPVIHHLLNYIETGMTKLVHKEEACIVHQQINMAKPCCAAMHDSSKG